MTDSNKNNFKLLNPFSKFPKSKQNQFSIVSWNTLIKTDTGNNASNEYNNWDYRLSHIHKTILSFESDIICLQECHSESFEQDFSDFCIKNGYCYQLNLTDYTQTQTQIEKATNNNDIKLNQLLKYGQMTTAILYKKDKFRYKYHDFRTKTTILLLEIISDEKQEHNTDNTDNTDNIYNNTSKKKKKDKNPSAYELYSTANNLAKGEAYQKWKALTIDEKEHYISEARKLKIIYKEKKNKNKEIEMKQMKNYMKKYLFVTNVHLEAYGKHSEKDKQLNKCEMRFNQIRHAIERITNYVKDILKMDDIKFVNAVFCGDFNEEIHGDIHKMLIGKNNENVSKKKFKNEFKLANAYIDNIIGIEKRVKNDIVSHWISRRLIDHFYYTYNNLKCIMCMETVPEFMKCEGNIVNMKYPNKDIVSDHLPIGSMFEIVRNEEKKSKRKLEDVEQDEPNKKKRKLNDSS